MSRTDPSSFGNITEIRQTHLHLDLNVNFETSRLEGFAELQVRCDIDTEQLVLDSSALTVTEVTVDGASVKVCR